MRHPRRWEDGDFGPQRPLCFKGIPMEPERPSSFTFNRDEFQAPSGKQSARLYYRVGWTAIIFWNSDIYFVDDILTFDGIIELIRARFSAFYLQAPINRDHVD